MASMASREAQCRTESKAQSVLYNQHRFPVKWPVSQHKEATFCVPCGSKRSESFAIGLALFSLYIRTRL